MHKLMLLLAGASLAGLLAPPAFEAYRDNLAAGEAEAVEPADPVVEASLQGAPPPANAGRVTRLAADANGHYQTEARINGRPVPVLVDTGATYVSMSEDTARRLGIVLRPDDYIHKAQTANGVKAVALATVDRVRIGGVEVRNVEAMVSRGDGLPITLLGMSFLKKLERFEVRDGRLSLVQ